MKLSFDLLQLMNELLKETGEINEHTFSHVIKSLIGSGQDLSLATSIFLKKRRIQFLLKVFNFKKNIFINSIFYHNNHLIN